MGRPRKMRARNGNGRLRPIKVDHRYDAAQSRINRFGVTRLQSINPLCGYLAGMLYFRGLISSDHLGRFHSFVQMVPRSALRGITYADRVQGTRFRAPDLGSKAFRFLAKKLGAYHMLILHELANDRLICSVERLKFVLRKIPLTRAGSEFTILCETHSPKIRGKVGMNETAR